ncbi:PKD domain-containing protein [Fulvivirgaceae bacterium PWU4]|uniref:PKD domain-containing protein n=1 Tax=Chryseosolibacter histidini TaxID=2782349 RepID=A0AAP2DLJ0_9BACT|nr:PKD domain-containing protein [Chryseosolibacter histidini]MBT1698471.1 PKD domain-containing protein [Chryseosolibacter histidini]
MKRLLSLLGLVISLNIAFAQDVEDNNLYSPPSPNAYGAIKYASIPVSPYTGTAAVTLPITELKGRKLSLPVTLNYHTAGIKVQDVPGWVGLGWSLNAGGLISRVVRGLPDEKVNGYCGSNNVGEKAYQSLNASYVQNLSGGAWDGEPDMFYFNFMGKSGAFILSETGAPVFLPHSNISLIPAICGISDKWVLTDADGTVYTFGGDNASRETTSSKMSGAANAVSYISSWYLSEIKTPSGETISFTYQPGESINYNFYTQVNSAKIYSFYIDGSGACDMSTTGTTSDKNVEITISSPRYLYEVSSTLGKMRFNSLPGREDELGRYLSSIVMLDYNGNLVEEYDFDYGYFSSDDCTGALCKRLKLNKVSKSAGGTSIDLYSFQYNSTNLPGRNSHAVDHWGFFNANTADTKVPRLTDHESPCGRTHEGADKSPDSLRSRANILEKIVRATGGFTEFVYAAHQYKDATGDNQIAGGVRIRIVRECASDSECKATYYYYKSFDDNSKSSGVINGHPEYHFRSRTAYLSPVGVYGGDYLIRQSQSLTNLFDINGAHVTYSNVREKMLGNGYVLNYFTNSIPEHEDLPGEHPNGVEDHCNLLPEQFGYYVYGGSGQAQSSISPDGFPYTPRTLKSGELGLLTDRLIYNEEGKLLSADRYEYKFDLAAIKSVPAYKAGRRAGSAFGATYHVGRYYLISRPYVLKKTTTSLYDQSTPAGDLTNTSTIMEYAYDLNTLLPTEIAQYNSVYPSFKKITKTKYVSDFSYYPHPALNCQQEYNACMQAAAGYSDPFTRAEMEQECNTLYGSANCIDTPGAAPSGPEADAIQTMIAAHQLNAPVEVQNLVSRNGETKLVFGAVYKYSKIGNSPNYYSVTKDVWSTKERLNYGSGIEPYLAAFIDPADGSFNTDTRMRKVHSYDSYDASTGNLLAETKVDGIPTAYEWSTDYQKNYVTAFTSNPNTAPSEDYQHRKSIGYKPLIGPTSEIDENDRSKYYEYDWFGALLLERDNNSFIKKRYRTSYVNASFAGVELNVAGITHPGNSMSFSFADSRLIGGNRYVWDFGDGQVLEGTSTPVSHSYSSPGNYTVKLATINPEYGSVTTNKLVTVYGPPVVTASSNCGNVYYCKLNRPSCTLYASVSGGCPDRTVEWYQRTSGSEWTFFGTGTQFSFTVHGDGALEFKCVVTETASNCGMTGESNIVTINVNPSPDCEEN